MESRTKAATPLGVAAAAIALVILPCVAATAGELDLRAIFAARSAGAVRTESPSPARPGDRPTGEEIVRRALDNAVGFDAAISVEVERVRPDSDRTRSAFLLQRHRMGDARRLLFVNLCS
jgi:hypothetical protein